MAAKRAVTTEENITEVKEETVAKSNTTETVKTPAKSTTTRKSATSAKKASFDASEPIMCTSVTAGELIMIGRKTKNLYRWANYGDTEAVEYQDLQAAKLTKSQYVYSPLFMIENNELLEAWTDVQELYNKICDLKDIGEMFKLDNSRFKSTITALPVGIKNTLKTVAYDMVESGVLDSLTKIKIIDSVLGTDIMSLIKG